jgi:hypothetical protein
MCHAIYDYKLFPPPVNLCHASMRLGVKEYRPLFFVHLRLAVTVNILLVGQLIYLHTAVFLDATLVRHLTHRV